MAYRIAKVGVDVLDDQGGFVENIRRSDRVKWAAYDAHRRSGGEVLPMPVPAAPVLTEAYVKAARMRIDEAAGAARRRYLTSVAGQEATYTAKFADAKAYVAAGYPEGAPDNHWVRTEADEEAVTYTQKADQIVYEGSMWHDIIGPAIEGKRLVGKKGLLTLTTIAEVNAHVATVIESLDAI